ncbi:hypothetical protein N2152v2_001819 [Parachlorella kessleri]
MASAAALCEPHPWLLPPRAQGLSYSGVTNEEELLALRVAPFKQHSKTLSLFVFTRSMAVLAQNYVYTLVRFAGVTNYVAATGSPEDFQACLDLNLPCWDAARFIPNLRLNASDEDSLHGTKQYNAITWWKPRLVAYLVERGFVVHMSDVDIAYSTKPLWASYLRYIEDVQADAAMAHELGRVKDYGAIQFGLDVQANTGNYAVLPTPGGRALMHRWAEAALLYPSLNDQQGFFKLRNVTLGTSHDFCWMPHQCERARAWADDGSNKTGVVRLYALSSMTHFPSGCLYSNTGREEGMTVDPCHWTMMYVHVICRAGAGRKTKNLKRAGFWFIDDSEILPAGQIPRCKPLRWNYPHIEDEFLRLHLVRTSANDGGRKPVVLLLHGFPEGWFSWRHQMEALRDAGWCAVAMDLRGYGTSDKPQDINSYRMRLLVEDVVGVIRAIAPPDTGRVALCGHDWGGMIGWHVAHMYPELVDRLAVVCFPHPQRFKCSQMSLEQLRRCWYIFAFQLPWLPELLLQAGDYNVFDAMFLKGPTACKRPGAVTSQQVERYKIAFSQPGALTGSINYYRALLDESTRNPDHSVQKALQRPLTMPVLLMWADQDAVLRPPLLRGTEKHVLNLRVHMLENCSHWAQQDRPEEVNRLLKDFLLPAASQ